MNPRWLLVLALATVAILAIPADAPPPGCGSNPARPARNAPRERPQQLPPRIGAATLLEPSKGPMYFHPGGTAYYQSGRHWFRYPYAPRERLILHPGRTGYYQSGRHWFNAPYNPLRPYVLHPYGPPRR